MADQDDRLIDHEYDGIREYDNPCPFWWHLVFIGTVLFSVLYYVFFQIGPLGWTTVDAHQSAVARDLKLRFATIGELTADEATLLEYMNKADWLSVGQATFERECKSCHAADGSGLIGVNLTDDHYKNVKQLTDVADVIAQGAAVGAMPAFGQRMHPNDVVLVAAYVASLRGQNLPGPRGAEGEVIPPWPDAPAEPAAAEEPSDEEAP